MADAQRLVDAFVVELERQHLAGREQLELGDGELDVAGRAAASLRVASLRGTSSPRARTTHSSRSACATACASGERSGSITSCTMPVRSRRSMNTSPP